MTTLKKKNLEAHSLALDTWTRRMCKNFKMGIG
jgi:hypothetical protein